MYKVKRVAAGNLTSKGITFEFGKEVEVTDLVYQYLKQTFPNDFEFIEKEKEKKIEKKPTTRKTQSTKRGKSKGEVVTK